jgi:GntR family transcriptional regulator
MIAKQKLALDRTAVTPLYHQLKEILVGEIRSGRLKPSDQLPPEDQIAASYGVSMITVRRSLIDMAVAGYIRRERGRGTFVAHGRLEKGPHELTSFRDEMTRRGLTPGSVVLTQKIIQADGNLVKQLNVEESAEIFCLRRLRLGDGEPLALQTAHIPLQFAPGIMDEDFERGSLYGILEEHFGMTPERAREVHSAAPITGDDAKMLEVPEGSVGLAGKRWTFLENGQTLEFVTSIARGDRYEIALELVRGAR